MEIDKEYVELREDYEDFLREVIGLINKLLNRNHLPTALGVVGRVKTLESIKEKIISERSVFTQSVTDFDDLVGLRIVFLFPESKDKCLQVLSREFDCEIKPEIRESFIDKFGYSSTHAILRVKEAWTKTPNWAAHATKRIEVQIRTLSEHAWAETSHELFYKREENIPKALLRDLNKISALLEVVDDSLQSLKNRIISHFRYIEDCEYDEILKLDLYPETFRRVMRKNSNNLYNLNDYRNRELSVKLEKEFNILTTASLDELIADKIDLIKLNGDEYVNKVLEILAHEKNKIDSQQQTTSNN